MTWATDMRNGAPDDATKPLRRARHEKFVQAYLETFDGNAAAQKAGYSQTLARRIWPILLSAPKIATRLKGLRWGGSVPNLEPSAVLKALAEDAFADAERTWLINPFTGQMVQCLARAEGKLLNRATTKTKVVKRGGVTSVIEELTVPGRSVEVGVIARALGLQLPIDEQAESGGIRGSSRTRSLNHRRNDDMVEWIARARRGADMQDAAMQGVKSSQRASSGTD